jgi:mitochondrial fission protein ELM1
VVADVLESALTVPVILHRYRRDDPDNPYFGVLSLADALVVTSDSVAMLSEAAATGRPVYIFDLGAPPPAARDHSVKSLCYRAMMRVLPARLSRDISLFHDAYVAAGHGSWSFDGFPVAAGGTRREIDATVSRVQQLLAS